MKAGALALDVFKRNPKHPGAVHYAIHAFDDPIHAPLALDAARVYAEIVPAVSHAVHMPTHIFIQHGMWNEVAHQNVRAFNIAKELWQPGDVPGDMSHSGDWGQYRLPAAGRLRGGAAAHPRRSKRCRRRPSIPGPRASSRSRSARYIIETQEWKVQPVAENASNETVLANGMSAVHLGDIAVGRADAGTACRPRPAHPAAAPAAGGAHADHGGAPHQRRGRGGSVRPKPRNRRASCTSS